MVEVLVEVPVAGELGCVLVPHLAAFDVGVGTDMSILRPGIDMFGEPVECIAECLSQIRSTLRFVAGREAAMND